MTEPRLQFRDLWLTSPEPTFRAPQEGTVRAVTPSTMTTTTFVAANLTSAYVGMYVVPEDGAIRGQVRQIKSWVTSTTTATVDTAWSSTASVTTLRLWNPPNPPVVADSGTTTSVTDATHGSVTNEPDDYYNEDHLMAFTGNNAGGAYKIADFTQTGGVFDLTGDPLGTAAAPGDLFIPAWMVRSESPVAATVERGTISRRITGRKEADQAVPITAHGSVEMVLPQRPLTAAASGVAVPPKDLGRYLRDFMTQTLDTGSTFSSTTGSTPGSIVTNVASGTGFTIGGFCLLTTGEASGISNKATANALTTPHRTAAAPIAAATVYASCWYQMKESDFRTRSFYGFRGGMHRQNFHGCAPTLQIKISRDQLVTFNLKYSASSASEWALSSPFNGLAGHRMSLVDQTVPVDGKGARFLIDYIPVFITEVMIDVGVVPVPRNSLSGMDQMDGYAFNLVPTKYTFTGYHADNDETSGNVGIQDRLSKGNTVDLFYQKGSAPGETFCSWAPAASITKSTCNIDNELLTFNAECEVVHPQAARGNSAVATLPPASIGLC